MGLRWDVSLIVICHRPSVNAALQLAQLIGHGAALFRVRRILKPRRHRVIVKIN